MLVCVWEDQREISTLHAIKFQVCCMENTVEQSAHTAGTVILILVCNQSSKQPPLILLPACMDSLHRLKWFTKVSTKDHCTLKPAQCVVQNVASWFVINAFTTTSSYRLTVLPTYI